MATVSEKRPRIGEVVVTCSHCGGRCKAGSSRTLYTLYQCVACKLWKKVPRPPRG